MLWLLQVALAQDFLSPAERLNGATVNDIQYHQEFVRYQLQLDAGDTLLVELQPQSTAGSGACTARGYTLSPRWELLKKTIPREKQPPFVKELCMRLSDHGVSLPRFEKQVDTTAKTAEKTVFEPIDQVRHRWLWGGVLLWGFLCFLSVRALRFLWASPQRNALLILGASSVLIRVFLSSIFVFNGAQAGYEKILDSIGTGHPLYGFGISYLMNALYGVVGLQPDLLMSVNWVLSCICPLLLWRITALLYTKNDWTSHFAALGFIFLPLSIKLAATEIYIGPLIFWELLAMLYWLSFVQSGRLLFLWIAIASSVLVLETRPEAISFLGVIGGVYLLGRKNPKKIEVGVLVGILILSLYGVNDGVIDQGQTFFNWHEFTQITYWRGFLPHGGSHAIVWSDWRITPPLFYLLMCWGIWKAERKTRYILGVWFLCSWIPVSTKLFPIADAIRLWYPLQLPLLIFVGVGAGAIAQRWGSKGVILAFSVSLLPHVTWIEQRWIQQKEWSLAKEALPLIPEGDRLQMDSSIEKWEKKAMVFAWLYPGTLKVIPFQDEDGWFWRGPFCINQRACRSLWERCSVEAYRTWRLGSETDVDIYIEDSEVDVGLYRVQNCSAQGSRE